MQTYEKNFPKQMFRKVFKQFLFIHTIAVARVLEAAPASSTGNFET